MIRIGCHLSSSGGFLAMGKEAVSINANTFQCFLRNPRGAAAKPLNLADVEAYNQYAADNDIKFLLGHAPYTANPCAAQPHLRDLARDMVADDLARLAHIPGSLYTLHPGNHVGQGVDAGIKLIADMLNDVLQAKQPTMVLLETMAGKGTEIGGAFEELKAIIRKVKLKKQVGVCFDTCHVFDAGYDIVNNLDGVLEEFDKTVGLSKIKAIHLNDSKNLMGSRVDRHEMIGEGRIGLEAFVRIVNHPALKDIPFYLETPTDLAGYAKEIATLRGLAGAL